MPVSLSRRSFLTASAASAAAAPFLSLAAFAKPKGKVAAGGFDVVAYFSAKKDSDAVAGSAAHTAEFDGATYKFASAANKAKFLENPEKFAPKYGGHCAWAASRGYIAPGDPQAWTVVDGRLYLNFNKNVRSRWRKDIPGHIAKADKNWPGLKAKA